MPAGCLECAVEDTVCLFMGFFKNSFKVKYSNVIFSSVVTCCRAYNESPHQLHIRLTRPSGTNRVKASVFISVEPEQTVSDGCTHRVMQQDIT